jgi:hypothetical protein
MQKKDRTGEVRENKQGYEMKIVHYGNNKDVVVDFGGGITKHTSYYRFVRGKIALSQCEREKLIQYLAEDTDGNNKAIAITLGAITTLLGLGLISAILYGIAKLIE